MKILLTGGTGQLGHALFSVLSNFGNVWAPTRRELNLADSFTLTKAVRCYEPDLVVNAGAFTDVDLAEKFSELCFSINADAPRILAEECAALGATLIHYSTDYVFNGKKKSAYVESDPTSPLGTYGESKLIGELAVSERSDRFFIIRTSWLFDPEFGTNFYRTMVKLFGEKDCVRVVSDQFGRPTSVAFLVKQSALLISALKYCDQNKRYGVYHLAEMDPMSWFEFASWIFDVETKNNALFLSRLMPVTSEQFQSLAPRPPNSVLDTTKWTTLVRDIYDE